MLLSLNAMILQGLWTIVSNTFQLTKHLFSFCLNTPESSHNLQHSSTDSESVAHCIITYVIMRTD
jgi:hypothetical protein